MTGKVLSTLKFQEESISKISEKMAPLFSSPEGTSLRVVLRGMRSHAVMV